VDSTGIVYMPGWYIFWKPFTQLLSGDNVHERFPFFLFILLSAILTVLAVLKNLSLIPVLGLMSCFYLMTELTYQSWIRFLVWLIIGLVLYFTYGYKHSVLGKDKD
jgi:APA family basic amino acid/polyamine antiporter